MREDPRHLFFFNDTATTEIYTLSLHDALPISACRRRTSVGRARRRRGRARSRSPSRGPAARDGRSRTTGPSRSRRRDRKSTRLNSSHANISYAVFCLKKKKIHYIHFLCTPLFT